MKKEEVPDGKKYEAPTVSRVSMASLPDQSWSELAGLLTESNEGSGHRLSKNDCSIILNLEGKFKWVSNEFCALVGYDQAVLLGKPIDDITASRTVNIPQHLGAVVHFGQFHNLWVFVHREGRAILARCDWKLLPDASILIFCQLVAGERGVDQTRAPFSQNP